MHHDIAAGNGCWGVVGEAVGSVELDQDRILTRACGTTVGRTHFERVTWFPVHSALSIEDQEISADIDPGDGCARKPQRLGRIATVEGEGVSVSRSTQVEGTIARLPIQSSLMLRRSR